MFEDDLATMEADSLINESAAIGAVVTTGAFEWTDSLENDGSGLAPVRHRTFTYSLAKTAFNAAAVKGATITIAGSSYVIRNAENFTMKRRRLTLA